MTFRLGLTGSIGMGKSTTAEMFVQAGCALWDADAAVHKLYGPGGAAVAPIAAIWPEAVSGGAVSRDVLKEVIARDPEALERLESIVHPLVAQDRAHFAAATAAEIAVYDIPLLFENGTEAQMDAVACVFVAPEVQEARVLARGTMSEAQFRQILAKQMPIEEKLARADFRIETDTLEHARAQVNNVLKAIRYRTDHA